LCKKFGQEITDADYQTRQLAMEEGVDVKLVYGSAVKEGGEKLPYRLVVKVKEKGHPSETKSCRDHDLYTAGLGAIFTDRLRWAEYYHFEVNDNVHVWMEYIDGVTGKDLSVKMLEDAAEELGRFQARLYKNPGILSDIGCLDIGDYLKRNYRQWSPKTAEYKYIRSRGCTIPSHLTEMLIGIDDNFDDLYGNIKKLPVVLCHRDFWVDNIFYVDGDIVVIDWDFASWGYMGEDIACLIADDIADMNLLDEYYRKLIPAYFKGVSEYLDVSRLIPGDNYIWEMIMILFGYRFVKRYMESDSAEYKEQQITALQKLYDIKDGIHENHRHPEQK
jgi:thiamine kinase-like enzyme